MHHILHVVLKQQQQQLQQQQKQGQQQRLTILFCLRFVLFSPGPPLEVNLGVEVESLTSISASTMVNL